MACKMNEQMAGENKKKQCYDDGSLCLSQGIRMKRRKLQDTFAKRWFGRCKERDIILAISRGGGGCDDDGW